MQTLWMKKVQQIVLLTAILSNAQVMNSTSTIVAYAAVEGNAFTPEILCRSFGLNEAQVNICIEHPTAMAALSNVLNNFVTECEYQFFNNRWNCTESTPPIIGETSPELRTSTKEAAFVYALTSAATVYTITKACSNGDIDDCGCDTTFNGQKTLQGWYWGGCSDDVDYGVLFARKFLDARETEAETNKTESEVDQAVVNLHNNIVGRMVVQDGMEVDCICHGPSGSCSVKTCWRKLPDLHTIGNMIRNKYDEAIKVFVQHTKEAPATLRSVGDEPVTPTTDYLVFMKTSPDYCLNNTNYTEGRQCIPESVKSDIEAGTPLYAKVDEKLPVCEDFCCNGDYELESKTIVESCNCRFVWCCDIMCEECTTTQNTYTCTG